MLGTAPIDVWRHTIHEHQHPVYTGPAEYIHVRPFGLCMLAGRSSSAEKPCPRQACDTSTGICACNGQVVARYTDPPTPPPDVYRACTACLRRHQLNSSGLGSLNGAGFLRLGGFGDDLGWVRLGIGNCLGLG